MLLYNIIYTDLQLQQEGSGVGMYRSSHFISLLHQTDRGGFPFWLVFCHPESFRLHLQWPVIASSKFQVRRVCTVMSQPMERK